MTIPADLPGELAGSTEARTPLTALLRDHRLGLLVLGGGLLSITVTWWEADGLVLVRRQTSLSGTGFAALCTIAATVTVLCQIPATRVARRYSTGRLLFVGALVQGLGLAGFALAGFGYPALVAAVVLVSVGQMLYGPALSTFVTLHAPPGRRAMYQAGISTTQDIGTALGPTTGLVLGQSSAPPLIWLLALPLGAIAGGFGGLATRTKTAERTGANPSPDIDEFEAVRR